MPINFDNVQITGGLTFIPEILTPTGDPYWANVSLLMNNTTTNNQTNNTFLDSSTNNFTVTRVGTPTQGSITPFTVAANTSYSTSVNGGSSGTLNMTDYLQIANNAAFNPGSGDFTIEAWIYLNSISLTTQVQAVIAKNSGLYPSAFEWILGVQENGKLQFGTYTTGLVSASSVAGTITANTWYHVAVSRQASTLSIYANGTRVGNTSISGSIQTTNAPVTVGRDLETGTTRPLNGIVSSVRMVKGTAVYTGASYTVPTAPLTAISGTSLLLNFTNGGIFDGATKNNLTTIGDAKVSNLQAKFGTTSVRFDGTGDYIQVPNNNVFGYGTGDFTIEFWYRPSALVNTNIIWDQRPLGTATTQPTIYTQDGQLRYYTNGTNRILGSTLSVNIWYHIAVCRSGTSTRMFVNGTQVGNTYLDSTNYTVASTGLRIGADQFTNDGNWISGFLQELRVTKGVSRYTANFTPPTQPFPTF